jgi:hypothetical protein
LYGARIDASASGELKIAGLQVSMLRYARQHPRAEFFIIVKRKHVIGPSRPR